MSGEEAFEPQSTELANARPHTAYELRPRIETARLLLRPMHPSDAAAVVEWRSKAGDQFLRRQPTLEEHLAWFASERLGRVDYVIVRKEDRTPIGVMSFRDIDETERVAETGKLIGDPDSRGRGFAKEATIAWLLYGFGVLDLERTYVWTRSDNAANIHINLNLGFERTDEHHHANVDGAKTECIKKAEFIKMTLTRERYLQSAIDLDPALGELLAFARDRNEVARSGRQR